MNKNSLNNKNTAQIGPAISSNIRRHVRDVAPSSRSTYDKICLFCIYSKTFTKRLVKDILKSLVRFWFPNQVPLASHLADLISTHERLRAEREFHTITYSRGTTSPHTITEHGCFGQYLRQRENEPTSECHHYIASEDSGLHTLHTLNQCPAWETPRREPWLAARMRGRPAPPSESNEVSEDSIDVAIPSFPGSPRSFGSVEIKKKYHNIEQVVDFLEHDDEFLIAAELGDEKLLTLLLQKGVDVNKKDHLERNALHLAVCSGNRRAVLVLLNAGVTVNVKSNVGMTPLSLCLMRRPSWRMANMLFDYGAIIVPRNTAMDTGLFLQFVMMCIPTKEEERILRLLVEKGALVDDPSAPGGRQALHFAAMSNNCRLIKILLDMGANPLLTNHRHQTPKQVAVTYQCKDAHKLLAEIEETMLKEKEL